MPRPDHNSSSLIIVLAPSEAGVEKTPIYVRLHIRHASRLSGESSTTDVIIIDREIMFLLFVAGRLY